LDVRLTCCHDRYRPGPLSDRHADLEEMFQLISIYGDTISSTVGSTDAGSQSTALNWQPTIRLPNQMHPFQSTSTSREETPRRKGEILEQYFKRHPSTKFNQTPSAKYILL
jgi:hypothetical protein